MDVIAAVSDAGTQRVEIEVLRDKKLVKLGAALDPDAPQTSFNSFPSLQWFHDFIHGAREGAQRPTT
jgi:hypothetical protein